MAVAQKGFQISASALPQKWLRDAIVCIDSHTGGEPTRLVVGGIPEIPGDNAREKTRFFADNLNHLRTTLTGEPRAHQAMHALVLCPATSEEADFGVIIMCALGYLDMCGHALIGAVTTVLEAGIIKANEPETVVTVETPAGIMRTRVHVVNGKVLSVTFRNQPAFAYRRDLEVCVEPFGNLKVDIAYGGLWYVIVDAEQTGISLGLSNLDHLSHASRTILKAVNSAIAAEHPILGPAGDFPQLLFTGPPTNPEADGKNFNLSTELASIVLHAAPAAAPGWPCCMQTAYWTLTRSTSTKVRQPEACFVDGLLRRYRLDQLKPSCQRSRAALISPGSTISLLTPATR